ncbi:hypothetical protein CPT_Shady_017 [Streptomyces phage Shady]|uniref:Uncharacterized protein n=1 Tax=Streptomyces phage Shady TaxID=2767585 RepID=A0A873WHZ4_9CAUD|nr:hypothetical protein CPT_Shady_017 [Streptomyces phage Shady]
MEVSEVQLNVNEGVCRPSARVVSPVKVVSVDIAIVDETSGGIASPGVLVSGSATDGVWQLPFDFKLSELSVHAEIVAFGVDGSRAEGKA